jgi:uncharacterized Rmd1/YagE family protein
MPRRGLLEEMSPKHTNYATITDFPAELDEKTLEEAAAAMRDRLPGRSRKAKGRFRRQQRGEKGDQWRGRLSSYCEASSYDLEKLTGRLKDERNQPTQSTRLYSRRWRVKAHFDVLHLHGYADNKIHASLTKSASYRGNSFPIPSNLDLPSATANIFDQQAASIALERGPSVASAPATVSQDAPGYQTYDTEVSDGEIGKGGLAVNTVGLNPDLTTIEDDTVDIFLFAFGPVVFWGFNDPLEEQGILSDLREFVDGQFHDAKASDDAMEEMEFTYRDTANRIINDLIELTTFKSGEKLSISSAIAQSCHLSIHEWRLWQTINRNNHIPKELADTGMINMTADEISKEVGRLFVERNLINLEPELLE